MIYSGEVVTKWNSVDRIMQVNNDHRGTGILLVDSATGEELTAHSFYSVNVTQDHTRIGLGVNWCVAYFNLDKTTFLALDADPKYLILWSDTDQSMTKTKKVPGKREVNKKRGFLVNLGVHPNVAAKLSALGITRQGAANNIKSHARFL